jgi:hypothetical protein
MLDVGQGLAMVIERQGKAILYDTGLAWPGGDSAQRLIIPGFAGITCGLKALFSVMNTSTMREASHRCKKHGRTRG